MASLTSGESVEFGIRLCPWDVGSLGLREQEGCAIRFFSPTLQVFQEPIACVRTKQS